MLILHSCSQKAVEQTMMIIDLYELAYIQEIITCRPTSPSTVTCSGIGLLDWYYALVNSVGHTGAWCA